MELWVAATFFIICAGSTAVFAKRYRKSKKRRFLYLAVIAATLTFALMAYAALTFALLSGVR